MLFRSVGIVLVQKSITAAASSVIVMIAMVAQSDVVVAIDILVPDAFAAAFAGGSVIFQTVGTNDLPVPFCVIVVINKTATALTIQGFFGRFYFFIHLFFLRKMKIALPISFGRALCLGLIFFCQEHGGMVGVVNDIDLCGNGFLCRNLIFLAVLRLFRKVVDVLFSVTHIKLEYLEIVPFFWQLVNTVP